MNTDRANNTLSHIRTFGVQWGGELCEDAQACFAPNHNIQQIIYFPEWLGGGLCWYGQHHTIGPDFTPSYQGLTYARPKDLFDGESYQPFINWEL